MPISKSQIDRLGDQLKKDRHTEADLRLLDEYRRTFGEASEIVAGVVRKLGQSPTVRLAKSTPSIAEKLRRESIRLSQMQDIAGCRVVVANVIEQDDFIALFKNELPEASIVDRRDNPSHGYRAVHVIAQASRKPVEIQVRTSLQHLWAEVSEKSSDVLDPAIKYGGGSQSWRDFLKKGYSMVAAFEKFERIHFPLRVAIQELNAMYQGIKKAVSELPEPHAHCDHVQEMYDKLEVMRREIASYEQEEQVRRSDLVRLRKANADLLTTAISRLEKFK